MNLTEAIRKIRAVAYALDQLEVKGHTNLDILLGSIQNLNATADQLERGLREMEPKAQPEVKLEIVPAEDESPAE